MIRLQVRVNVFLVPYFPELFLLKLNPIWTHWTPHDHTARDCLFGLHKVTRNPCYQV